MIRRILRVFIFLGLTAAIGAPGAAAAPPLVLGGTISKTGPYAQPSAMMAKGVELWVADVNRRGGLLGRRVEVVLLDDESRPQRTVKLYQQLIHGRRADLLLSPYGTPLTLAAARVAEKAGMVMVAAAASGEELWQQGFRHIFGLYCPATRYFIGLLDLAARARLASVGLVYEDSLFHRSVANGARQWIERLGMRLAYEAVFAPDGQGLEEALAGLIDSKPDLVLVSAYPPMGYRLLGGLHRRQWRPAALGMTIIPAQPSFAWRAGPAGDGVFAPSQWEPTARLPFPGTKAFLAEFMAKFHMEPSYHAAAAYSACQVLERAVTAVGGLDQALIRRHIRGMDTMLVLGRFKVAADGRQIGHTPLTVQWQNGMKQIVYPPRLRTAPPLIPFRPGAEP